MNQTAQQQAMMQEAAMQQQQRIQLDLSIMQMKMSLMALAKDIKKDLPQDDASDMNFLELYELLRLEVLGIPVTQEEKSQKDGVSV